MRDRKMRDRKMQDRKLRDRKIRDRKMRDQWCQVSGTKMRYWKIYFQVLHFHTVEIWSLISQSCRSVFDLVGPSLVLHFPVLYFPTLEIWSLIFQSCRSVFDLVGPSLVLHFPVLYFQSTRRVNKSRRLTATVWVWPLHATPLNRLTVGAERWYNIDCSSLFYFALFDVFLSAFLLVCLILCVLRVTRNTFCGTWYLPHSHVHNELTVPIMAGCMAHARNDCISTSGLKYDATIVFLDPDFL